MFIDIHAHVYRVKTKIPTAVEFCDPKELLKRYDELKIDCGVLLPIVNPEIYMPQSVEDILEVCEMYPDRFIPYCNVDPRAITNSPDAPLDQVVHYYKEKGCKGVGEVMPNLELQDPLVQNLFAAAAKEDLPIVYDGSIKHGHDFGLYDDPGLPQLEFTLQDYPNLKVFGHGPVFWNEIAKLHTVAERGCFWGKTISISCCPRALWKKRAPYPSCCASTTTSTATCPTAPLTTHWFVTTTTGLVS